MRTRSNPWGFTLIELLVVVAIITLLLAILLPSLGRAKASASQQVCGSNLAQIALAAYNYAGDNEGLCLPLNAFSDGVQTVNGITGNATLYWCYMQVGPNNFSFEQGLVGPYVKTIKSIQCPAMEQLNLPVTSVANSYGSTSLSARKLNQITMPSGTPIFADSVNLSTAGGVATLSRPTQIFRPSGAPGYDSFHGRHANRMGEVGFYDGHVEAVQAQIRPAATYSSPKTPAQILITEQVGVGPLVPQPIDFSQIPDSATYNARCKTSFDYYFWLDKSAMQ